jgi:hypothetical protein
VAVDKQEDAEMLGRLAAFEVPEKLPRLINVNSKSRMHGVDAQ